MNSAPEQYQNVIRQTIADCPGAINIADNIVVYGKTNAHDRNARTTAGEKLLTLNNNNCKIGISQITFHGTALE